MVLLKLERQQHLQLWKIKEQLDMLVVPSLVMRYVYKMSLTWSIKQVIQNIKGRGYWVEVKSVLEGPMSFWVISETKKKQLKQLTNTVGITVEISECGFQTAHCELLIAKRTFLSWHKENT